MNAARYASLIAFAQSRGFCPTGEGNGTDNSCGTAGGSAASYAIASDAITQSIPETERDAVRVGVQQVFFDRSQLENGVPFKTTTKVAEVAIKRPEYVLERAKAFGIKDPSSIPVIGCGTIPNAMVRISPFAADDGIRFKSTVPLGDSPLSAATVEVGISGTDTTRVKYGFFDLTPTAKAEIDAGKVSLSHVSATLLSVMSASLEAAEKNGFQEAVTDAAGNGVGRFASGPSDALQGYRLWPKFGFDADVGSMITQRFMLDTNPATGKTFGEGLSYEARRRGNKGESLRVQEIIETKQGEEWWNKHGSGTAMTLDFSNKTSLGYRRYKEMLAVGKKMTARLGKQGRSAFEFWLWAAEETGMPEFRNCEMALFPEQRVFCATGVGGGVKNDCGPGQTAKSFPEGSQNLRDAVDSVAPAPEQVWDRSRGLAETPAPKEIDDIANEQTSHSGAALTPEAEASYGSLVDEIGRQYEALTAAGLKARAWRGDGEPYGDPPGSTKPNSDHMRKEIAKTGEYSFFMTDKGFGSGDATPNHPMLRETKYKTADGEPMIANDLFRVVHDMVAHVRGGYSFSTNGEYNGMLTHASTLPEAAWPALFAETFGQNAVYEKTKSYAPQNAYASKVGPEIIRSELKKRNKSSRSKKDDGDEPLGYQHIKSRPYLLKSLVEQRGFCPRGEGNGIDNSCGAKTMSAPDKDGGGGSDESRSADCGRDDDGRFASGNRCGGSVDMPKEDPRGRMRYENGVQTDAARKLYQMGTTEKKLKALIDVMGGDPKNTRADINPPSVNVSVSDASGRKLFHVDVENGRARLYPTKDLSPAESKKIREAATEAFGGEEADTAIKVYRKAEDIKKWQRENEAKLKAWEDKYAFTTLLPPHQRPKKWERSLDVRHASLLAFAQSRDCGQEKDGKFSKGNTCAGGIAADAAKGAATGAVVGAVSGLAKTFLPQGAASGAAYGAVAGAVKGIYDNQMRPTRVSARIQRVGMTDKKVASIVKSLGGTSKSLASTNGRSGLTLTIRAKGGKISHVVDVTDKKVSIYPVTGRKEMTDDQIATVKKIASENAQKETTVIIKTNSLSYASRLAKKGFAVAAKGAGVLSATAITSAYAPAVSDVVLGVADLVFDTHFTDSFYRKPNAKR